MASMHAENNVNLPLLYSGQVDVKKISGSASAPQVQKAEFLSRGDDALSASDGQSTILRVSKKSASTRALRYPDWQKVSCRIKYGCHFFYKKLWL